MLLGAPRRSFWGDWRHLVWLRVCHQPTCGLAVHDMSCAAAGRDRSQGSLDSTVLVLAVQPWIIL